jgi:adenylate cyclase
MTAPEVDAAAEHEPPELSPHLSVGAPVFTVAEAADKSGIPAEVIARLWRALGFAIPAPGAAAFNDDDLVALEVMHRASTLDLMDVDTEVRLARALGQTMSRLADWQATTVLSAVDERAASPSMEDRLQAVRRIADALGKTYPDVLAYAWRRHVAAAVNRMYGTGELEREQTVTTTVGFADIVSFSALSNELDDDRIGDLVEIFETRATDVVTNGGGRAIKTLGDSVLFISDDPVDAADIAHGIIDVIGGDPRMPDVRLGLATGGVLLRFGDVFGPPVNLASRLTAIARRNRVITDDVTAAALPATRFEVRALTARPVRGFGVLEPMAVRRLARGS